MNGEQLCYMHGFVHRSLFIKIQNGDIPKCRYLNSIGCQFRITQLTTRYNLPTYFASCYHSSIFTYHPPLSSSNRFLPVLLHIRLWKKDRTLILHRRSYLLV